MQRPVRSAWLTGATWKAVFSSLVIAAAAGISLHAAPVTELKVMSFNISGCKAA